MEPFSRLTGAAAPLLRNDVNTDQIAPAGAHGGDPGAALFANQRYREDGSENADFVLNQAPYRAARILVTGENFGCGSSRESAVWALTGFGIRCVVARSFADIFRENCLKNGVLPVVLEPADAGAFERAVAEVAGEAPFTADLEAMRLIGPDGTEYPFGIDAAARDALLRGLDDIGLTLEHESDIAAWEQGMAARRPWLQTAPRPAPQR